MAANEIPIAGYGSTLLSRAEVAEGTMVFHFGEMSGGESVSDCSDDYRSRPER